MRAGDVADLRALAAIVAAGSFSAAAGELRVSRSALSQTIRQLEQRLGVLLLNRTTRSVAPTEACRRLLERFEPALAEMEAALREARAAATGPVGPVRVHAQRHAYEMHLRPALPAFLDRHPGITLEVRLDDAVIDIVAAGFDIGLRLGELLDQDVIGIRLGAELRQVAVAAPAYLERYGVPQKPKDLMSHRCIAFRWPGKDAIYNWEFEEDGAWFSVAITGPLVVSEQRAAIEAAVDGIGIAFWTEDVVQPLIAAGKLVPLLKEWSATFPGFYLFMPRLRHRAAAVQALVNHLRAQATHRR